MGRKLLELPAELPEQPLRDLLQYLHGGDVGLKWLPPMALERVQGLMEWGRFLLMPELVDHCQEYFRRRVQVGSIVTVWSIAEHFELEVATCLCFLFTSLSLHLSILLPPSLCPSPLLTHNAIHLFRRSLPLLSSR